MVSTQGFLTELRGRRDTGQDETDRTADSVTPIDQTNHHRRGQVNVNM
jgi:hypothetical protein